MRRVIILGISLLVAVSMSAQQQLSLDDCVAYALENNEQLQITEYSKLIAESEVREVTAQGLPQANINGALNYNFEVQQILLPNFFDPDAAPGDEVAFAFGREYDGNIALGVNQLLFDGSYFVGLQAARTFRELSTKDHIKTQIEIVEAVNKAYYNALIADEQLNLLNANKDRIDTLLFETTKLYEAGFAEKLDVDRLKVTSNNLKVEIGRARQLSEISKKLLKFQMGMELREPIMLSERLEDVDVTLPVIPSTSFDYGDRIEYSQLTTNETLAQLDIRNNKSQYLPKLYANFAYGYNTAAGEFSDLFNFSDRWLDFGVIGVTASIPVFDGFLKSNRIQQNRLQLKQLASQKKFLEKSIDLEIEQSHINLTTELETLEVQKQNVELAQYVFDISKTKYQEGVGSNLEVTDADTSLKEAQTNYLNSLYQAKISQIELKKALGTLYKTN